MPVTIGPRRSLLGDLSLGVSSFLGGYGSALGQNAPQGLASQALAGNQQAFQSAFNNSFRLFGDMAQQSESHRFRMQQLAEANRLAVQNFDHERIAGIDDYYIKQGYGPIVNGLGQPGTPNYVPSAMDRYNQYASNLQGPPEDFATWLQRDLQMFQKKQIDQQMQSQGMVEMLNETEQAHNKRIDQGIAAIRQDPQFIDTTTGQLTADGIQAVQQLERQKIRPYYQKAQPTPQQEAEMIKAGTAIIPTPDGGFVYNTPTGDGKRAHGTYKPPKPPAAGKGADAAAQPKLPPNVFEGPDGYLYAPHPSGDGPLQPVLGKRGPWAGKQITASQYRYERDSVQDDNGNWLIPKYNNDGVLVGHVPNPFNLQDQKAQHELEQIAVESKTKLTIEQQKARNDAIDADVDAMRKQADAAIKAAGDVTDSDFKERLGRISSDALLKFNDPGAFERKVRAEATQRVDQRMRQAQSGGQTTPAPPQIGEVRRGWQYIGGDPANPTSWRKVQ